MALKHPSLKSDSSHAVRLRADARQRHSSCPPIILPVGTPGAMLEIRGRLSYGRWVETKCMSVLLLFLGGVLIVTRICQRPLPCTGRGGYKVLFSVAEFVQGPEPVMGGTHLASSREVPGLIPNRATDTCAKRVLLRYWPCLLYCQE
jgi:hypothetical protein